jgi:Na+-transporting methylmalonyl-CoA/oxaloacetate decarboxylase gamma subunit
MDKWAFGLTMTVVGVGGTFVTLAILIWSIQLLKRLMPLSVQDSDKSAQS